MRSSSSWTHVNSELLAESSTSTLSTSCPPGAGAGTSPHLSLWLHSKRIHCALVNYIDSLVICSRWFTWAMKLTSLVWMFYLTFLALKGPVSTFCLDLNIGNIWDGAVQPPNPVPPDHLPLWGGVFMLPMPLSPPSVTSLNNLLNHISLHLRPHYRTLLHPRLLCAVPQLDSLLRM